MKSARKSENVSIESSKVTVADREERFDQKSVTLWMTGLSASGKSTIARAVESAIFSNGHVVYWLDGDNVRMGLNRDLGFSPQEREENIRRIAESARLFNDAGLIVIAAFISPYRADRQKARQIIGEGRFVEVFVDCPLSVCEERDPKGLYEKARRGEITEFTGITAPYETPLEPDLVLRTGKESISASVSHVMRLLDSRRVFMALSTVE